MATNEAKLINNLFRDIKRVVKNNKINSLHEPYLGNNEKKILNECIKKNEVSSVGRYRQKFEKLISEYTGVKYAVTTSSGTAALHLALKAIGVRNNHEIIVPSLNFVASVNAILYCNAIPHFVDINPNNLGIDPKALEIYLKNIALIKNNKCINKKTNKIIFAVVPVYVFGNSYDIEKLKRVCKKFKLKIIEDSAEALGTFYKKKHAGTFGEAGCLSFNGNKIITTGGGGAVLTNSKKIYEFVKRNIFNGKLKHDYELIYEPNSLNFRMPDINAAIGCAQIKNLNYFLSLKRNLAKRYSKFFKKNNEIFFLKENLFTKSNYWLNTILIRNINLKIRKKIFLKAKKLNIPLRPIWTPLHKNNKLKKFPKSNLKNTNSVFKKIINLPSSAILGK